ADVVEATQLARLVPGDEDGFAGQVAHHVVAGVRDVLGPPDADPVAPPDPLTLFVVDRIGRVVRAGQGRLRRPVRPLVAARGSLSPLHRSTLEWPSGGQGRLAAGPSGVPQRVAAGRIARFTDRPRPTTAPATTMPASANAPSPSAHGAGPSGCGTGAFAAAS